MSHQLAMQESLLYLGAIGPLRFDEQKQVLEARLPAIWMIPGVK